MNNLPSTPEEILLEKLEKESLTFPTTFRRKPVFMTNQELEVIITDYFRETEESLLPPCMTGLAAYLGMERKELLNYKEEPFASTIRHAIRYIKTYMETQLVSGKNTSGMQYWLNNNDDWSNKTEITHKKELTMSEVLKGIKEKQEKHHAIEGELAPPTTLTSLTTPNTNQNDEEDEEDPYKDYDDYNQ